MMEFVYAYAYFVLYAFLGWVCEDLYCGIPAKKFINRGFFYGPYCPIYGVGALLVLYPLLFVKDYPILVFVLGVIITSALEYITSWVMDILFKTRWWDYSERFMNINHFIWHYVYCGGLYHSSCNSRYRNGYSFYGIDEFFIGFYNWIWY